MDYEVSICIWDAEEISRSVLALETAATSSATDPTLARAALELARAFAFAGRALDYLDEDDGDVIFDLLGRLDSLRSETDRVLGSIHRAAAVKRESLTFLGDEETHSIDFDEVTKVHRRRVGALALTGS